MRENTPVIAALSLGLSLAAAPGHAAEQLTVMISGGFSMAYDAVVPAFERDTGIKVTTLSGASQGSGPNTIRSQLEHRADVDVVILSAEGLSELVASGRIVAGSQQGLASAPLAAAAARGRPKPDIGTMDGLKRALLGTRLLVLPGSTSGLFIRDEVFPRLGIAGKVATRVVSRGTEATATLASGEADLAIAPASELTGRPGIEIIGVLPSEAQLVQVFTAAIVSTSRHAAGARRLIAFLASNRTVAAIETSGMTPVGDRNRK